jgi:hypothetical protein
MPSGLILSQQNICIYTSWRDRVGNAVDGYCRRRPNGSRDKNCPFTKCQRPSRRIMSEQRLQELLVLKVGNHPSRRKNHKLVNGMKV